MACCGGRKLPEQGRRLGVKRAGPTAPGQHSARPGATVPSAARQRSVRASIQMARPIQGSRELLRRPPQRPGQAVRAEQSTAASVPQRGMVSVAAGNEQKGPEQKNFDSSD